MKVLGNGKGDTYLCEISHGELEKLTDQYYGKMKPLKIGDEMDLGAGYDFRADIRDVCRQMTNAETSFARAQNTLRRFAMMVTQLPEAPDEVGS